MNAVEKMEAGLEKEKNTLEDILARFEKQNKAMEEAMIERGRMLTECHELIAVSNKHMIEQARLLAGCSKRITVYENTLEQFQEKTEWKEYKA